jgi:hypothetical protein
VRVKVKGKVRVKGKVKGKGRRTKAFTTEGTDEHGWIAV